LHALKLALAAAITLSAVTPAHSDLLGPKTTPSGSPSGVARGGNSGPRPAGGGGDWHPNSGHSSQWGGDRGRPRSTPNHFGVRRTHGASRTLDGACPTFPTATTVIGARYGIPTQNGEARTGVGVIRNQRLAQTVVGGRDHGASHKAHGCRSRVATSYCASRALAAAKAIGSRSPVCPGWCRNRIRCSLRAVADRKL